MAKLRPEHRSLNSEATQCPSLQCFLVFTVSFLKLFLFLSVQERTVKVSETYSIICRLGLWSVWRRCPWGSLVVWMGSKPSPQFSKGAGLPGRLSLSKTFTSPDPAFRQSSLTGFEPSAPASHLRPEAQSGLPRSQAAGGVVCTGFTSSLGWVLLATPTSSW